jgi:GR25 family glycosyltransferase involved in LPS biosynthesis
METKGTMNLLRPQIPIINYAFRLWLFLRRLVPRRRCQAFGIPIDRCPKIEKIYVINLNREAGRWAKIKLELRRILSSSGVDLLKLAERYVAVDANEFTQNPPKDAEINPFYTLEDQLLVEPQPLVLPTRFELEALIRMSRAECAVARSHINVWKHVAASDNEYVLILEDDVWFQLDFARHLDKVWHEVISKSDINDKFDILYLSYFEVRYGAPKTFLSKNVFRPVRGLWHLSGYVLSRKGAEKLLNLLPCRGPIDLWINHQFETLDVLASRRPLINQRRDTKSTNSYSILPTLTKIGAITSEAAALYNIRPTEQPVFAFGAKGSGQSSLAMALSMLGYRCCSDFQDLPVTEMESLLKGRGDRIFNAYVNIGTLEAKIIELKNRYPMAKFILTTDEGSTSDMSFQTIRDSLKGVDLTILNSEELNKWRVICEHLKCGPPKCSFPILEDIGQRPILNQSNEHEPYIKSTIPKRDSSPWVIESRDWWQGISSVATERRHIDTGTFVNISDSLESHDKKLWQIRRDTFTDNLALFRPSNIKFTSGIGAVISVKRESVGVRDYTAASLSSQDQYLFGKFEATMQASNVPGVVTGLFLYRNSPRQEIDIEIAGNRPNRLLVNVFYNPGSDGANFDYGYRGSPTFIDLGFDASTAMHRFAIEWSPHEIRWLVDDNLVHKRSVWDPTPIPHLPMMFHVNSWVSRSIQLAGRINDQRLPATVIVEEINLTAHKTRPTVQVDDLQLQFYPDVLTQAILPNENIIVQSRP